MRRSTLLLLIALLALGDGCTRATPPEEAAEPKPVVAVETERARVEPIALVVAARGPLSPGEGAAAVLAPVSSGHLQEVYVREGDDVTAGQLVATIDNRIDRDQQQAATAALAAAQADGR